MIAFFFISSGGIKISDMMNRLGEDVYPKWALFATQLNMNSGTIHAIRQKEHNESIMCFKCVLENWENNPTSDYPFTMESAVAILRTPMIKLTRLANEIEQELGHTQETS